jgi:hypothetical protein
MASFRNWKVTLAAGEVAMIAGRNVAVGGAGSCAAAG